MLYKLYLEDIFLGLIGSHFQDLVLINIQVTDSHMKVVVSIFSSASKIPWSKRLLLYNSTYYPFLSLEDGNKIVKNIIA